jgi:hypothetical protein
VIGLQGDRVIGLQLNMTFENRAMALLNAEI